MESPLIYRDATSFRARVERALDDRVRLVILDLRTARIYSPDVMQKCHAGIDLVVERALGGHLRVVIFLNPASTFGGEVWQKNREVWQITGPAPEAITPVTWRRDAVQPLEDVIPAAAFLPPEVQWLDECYRR